MARKKRSELAAGIFVILAVGLIVGVVLWLGAADLFRPVGQRAFFYVPESANPGLTEGSAVQIGGAVIGRIVEIRPDFENTRTLYVAKIVRDGAKIYSDARSHVVFGIVGEGSLAVTSRGTVAKGLADRENPVRISGGLDEAMSNIGVAAEKLKMISEKIETELNPDQAGAALGKIHTILDSLRNAAAAIAGITEKLYPEMDKDNKASVLAKVHHSLDDIEVAAGKVRDIATDAKPKIEETLAAVRDTATRIEEYSRKDVARLLGDLRKVNSKILEMAANFATVSEQTRQIVLVNRENIDEMIDNMTLVSADLKATAREIRRNPWRLIHKPDDKQVRSQNIYDAFRAFSSGAEQLDQALMRLSALRKAHPQGLPIDDPQLQKIREHVEETFSRFSKAEQALWKELAK